MFSHSSSSDCISLSLVKVISNNVKKIELHEVIIEDDIAKMRPTPDGVIIKAGDIISINIPNRSIDLKIDNKIFEERMGKLPEFKPKIISGYLGRYARLVTSADTGAVLK